MKRAQGDPRRWCRAEGQASLPESCPRQQLARLGRLRSARGMPLSSL